MPPGYDRLDGGRAEGIDDAEPAGEGRIITPHEGQYVRVNSRRIDCASMDHVNRALVVARFNDPAEVTNGFPALHQVITGDAVSRLRFRFVISPRTASKVSKRTERAILPHDHVGKVNRFAPV